MTKEKLPQIFEQNTEFPYGRDVRVPRSNGDVEEGWKVVGVEGGFVRVISVQTSDEKDVEIKTLRALNWKKTGGEQPPFKVGDEVEVLRSNWKWDGGWKVAEIMDNGEVRVVLPIGAGQEMKKTISWAEALPSGSS